MEDSNSTANPNIHDLSDPARGTLLKLSAGTAAALDAPRLADVAAQGWPAADRKT